MSDATRDARAHLRAHLQFFDELGIAGFSRDAAWTGARRPQAASRSLVEAPVVGTPLRGVHDDGDDRVNSLGGHGSANRDGDGALGERSLPAESTETGVASLDALRGHIGPQCTRCKLCTLGRTQVVFGVGNPTADLMFVGEAPGADEDLRGEPFVGRAGQLLTKIIEAIDLRREDVYIANVIKCRPPGNRNPEPDEVLACEPFLFRQIDLIQPKVIVALGKFAAQSLLRTDMPITRLRGRIHPFRQAHLVPTFHPAYLLRSPDKKRDTWEDMKLVRSLLRGEVR